MLFRSNAAELTARTNDEGWENVFVKWLNVSNFNKNDMVLVFSVDGGDKKVSKDIVNALGYAKRNEVKIAGIVGRNGGYTKKVADICILIPNLYPNLVTPITETFHNLILHTIVFHPTINVN